MARPAARATEEATGRKREKGPLARLRAICLALPEANERVSHGEPTWFAGKGKVFAMLDDHHHGARAPLGLAARGPRRPGSPDRVGPEALLPPTLRRRSGWVGVVLDTRPDWSQVAWLVEQAYRLVAHKSLVAKLSPRDEA